MQTIRVALIEDSPGDARLIQEVLSDAESNARFAVTHYDRLGAAIRMISPEDADVILLDLSLPDSHGLDTLSTALASARGTPIVVITVTETEETAVQAVANGAQDYIFKGELDGRVVARAIRYAIERGRLTRELQDALHEIQTLSGLLPICAYCKKIRDDTGYWNLLETYFHEHAGVIFTHGICPECVKLQFPEYAENILSDSCNAAE